ncbi:MAG: FtsX-like permease family protein [Candidatus Thorarchaeota archaeon]|nr:FtsX-like permease family protein [Candidatus Thorarchaeota archaeon]
MFKYAIKRVLRGYKLFIALTIGVLIATTFFSSMIVSADVMTKEALLNALDELDYDARVSANNVTWSNQNFTDLKTLMEDIPDVTSVDVYSKYTYNHNASRSESFDIVGADPQSTLWNTFEHINGSASLAANETWVIASSANASLLKAGEIIQTSIPIMITEFPYFSSVDINLTIAGFIDIPSQTAQLLNPAQIIDLGFIQIPIGDWRIYDLLIVDWESTIRPVIQWFDQQENVTSMVMSSGFLCRLDRDVLVNPYDVGASAANIADTLARVEDRTAHFNTQVTNLIGSTLQMLSLMSGILILAFVSLAAPIIFMSWYSSTMLSDVSYNLRRREFGLLQTKGFGPKTIKRMLMFEGAIIGLIGGVTGLFFGTAVAHLILDVSMETPFVALSANPINTAVIIGFGLIIALWSVRGPADRAAKLDPLDSLKQYIYIEEQREYKKLLPRIALLLGTYKIVVWTLGISMQTLLATAMSSGFIVLIAIALWTPIDALLNFIGPILFLYGLTKILLSGSQKFQEFVVRVGGRFFGPFGALATRNVQRNPVRNAALVFTVALIVSYGLFSVGSLFAEQDRLERTNLYYVGSDVSASFLTGSNMTEIQESVQNFEGVTDLTVEYRLTLTSTRGGVDIRGMEPATWTEAAFYETSWFSGAVLEDVLSNFTGNKIILSVSLARQLELRVGNSITLRGTGSSDLHRMDIVALIGYVSPVEVLLADMVGDMVGDIALGGTYPSYVPSDYLKETGLEDISTGHLLMKTIPGTNGTLLEQEIYVAFPEVVDTDSSTTRVAAAQENTFEVGGTRARWVGILFGGVLAVVGTLLIVGLTLKEKEYETTLLGVRGFTRGQTLKVLAGEVLVMGLFSLMLGLLTGFIQLFGDIANVSESTQILVRPQIVLSPLAILGMAAIAIAVLISALIPVLMTSRFTEDKVDVLRE